MSEGSVDRETWKDYLDAARRKLDMSEFHFKSLDSFESFGSGTLPDLPVQAHFEGVLYSFIAAGDQLAEALRRTLVPDVRPPTTLGGLSHTLKLHGLDGLTEWTDAMIAKDVRSIRIRATHHHYAKRPSGPSFEVQKPKDRAGHPDPL